MADINIYHHIVDDSSKGGGNAGLDSSLNNLASKIDELITAMSKGSAGATGSVKDKEVANLRLDAAKQTQKNIRQRESLQKQQLLNLKQEERNIAKQTTYQKERRASMSQERQEREASAKRMIDYRRKDKNIGMLSGTALGLSVAAIYQAGAFGSIVGSRDNAINAGGNHYSEFMRDYKNKMLSQQQSTMTTGIMGGSMALGAAIGSIIPGVGTVIGAGVGALVGSLANYYTSKETAHNQAINTLAFGQDQLAYQLRAQGISGMSNQSIPYNSGMFGGSGSAKITKLQSLMMTPKYAQWSANTAEVMSNAKRDVMRNLSDTGKADFIANVSSTARALGTNNLGGLSRSSSILSSVTGKNPNDLLMRIQQNGLKYGGDTVNNLDKIIQLMQSTGLSYGQASHLANSYQNNPTWQSNIAAINSNTPMGAYIGHLMMQVGGASKGDLAQGYYGAKALRSWRWDAKHPGSKTALNNMARDAFMTSAMSYTHQNPYASAIAGINGTNNGTVQPTDLMNKFDKWVSGSLANIKIDTQYVTVTHAEFAITDIGFGAGLDGTRKSTWQSKTGTGNSGVNK